MDVNLNANLVLGGGGIKGLAYAGLLEEAEKRGIYFRSISGVSAGALAGACIAAGYKSQELRKEFYEFDFGKLSVEKIVEKVPVIRSYMEFCTNSRLENKSIFNFLSLNHDGKTRDDDTPNFDDDFSSYRGNLFKNIVKFSKQGCLYDGDLLEEWAYKLLARKGIRTFADLRGGIADYANPMGYKVRMTAVDAKRAKVIVLPDDMAYYGLEPDRLEVAKAIRMSTSVPFAFKPVEFYTNTGGKTKKHYIVDGGVLDNLPIWTISPSFRRPLIACRLNGGNPKKVTFDPLNILKGFINAVHDIGIPKYSVRNCFFISINTSKVSFLDFNLSDEDKEYLYNSGKKAAAPVFNKLIYLKNMERLGFFGRLRYLLSFRGF